MRILVVVESSKHWPLNIEGVEIVPARQYLTDTRFSDLPRARVFNLCRTYRYQTVGYYVSLLAEGRGHRPIPSVSTLQDLRFTPLQRIVSDDLQALTERTFARIQGTRAELPIYFGRGVEERYDRLCQALFNYFPAPFLRAEFANDGGWRLLRVTPFAASEIPDAHLPFVMERARKYFERPRVPVGPSQEYRYDLAILVNPTEVDAPSDDVAIQRFMRAARGLGMNAWLIDKDDFGRLAEYDALFIRETTYVNHHTYRFARRAEAEDVVVIDSSSSIVRCTNKVYLAEVFARNAIACPKTIIVHKDNADTVVAELGFPCVLKRPDSSFSMGVVKASNPAELARHLDDFFRKSELVVAQEYVPSAFDWRIGVLNGKSLYACRYFMARGHWQVQKAEAGNKRRYGKVETIPVEDAPAEAVRLAEKSAALIGDGLYGVDIKEIDGRFLVMEINDNPSIDSGVEDTVLKDELYNRIMRTFLERIELRGRNRVGNGGGHA